VIYIYNQVRSVAGVYTGGGNRDHA
jgi:hypothetical protein